MPPLVRTAVLRLRVYGQVAMGGPLPSLGGAFGGPGHQQKQQQWPPKVLEDVTSLLHGAAVISGPTSGVWTPQNRQELLLPTAAQGGRRRSSSRSR